jgi:hypothetical protein
MEPSTMLYMRHPEFKKNYILPSLSQETPSCLPNVLLKFIISAQQSIWVIFYQIIFMFYYSVLTFSYIPFKIIFLLICLHMLFISLVAMDHFYKSYVKTDLATLHYVIFIEPLAISQTEVLSFDFNDFTSNSMKKVIQGNINDSSLRCCFVVQKNYEVELEDLSHEDLAFFSEP